MGQGLGRGAVLRAKTGQDAQAEPYHCHPTMVLACLVPLSEGSSPPAVYAALGP